MSSRIICAVLAVSSTVPGQPSAFAADATAARAEAPVFQRGDCWTYTGSESTDPAAKPWRTQEVLRNITADGALELSYGLGDPRVRLHLDAAGNYVQRPGWRWEPSQSILRFPMIVGDSWHAPVGIFVDGSEPVRMEADFKVRAYGKVRVEAGEFDAFEVHEVGSARAGNSPFIYTNEVTLWYAPAVHRLVQVDTSSRATRYNRRWHQELASYGHVPLAASPDTPASEAASSASTASSADAGHC